MKSNSELKQIARNSLKGKWSVAISTGLLASILGSSIWDGGSSSSTNNEDNILTDLVDKFTKTEFWSKNLNIFIGFAIVLAIWVIIQLIIGGAIRLGYCQFNLKLIDNKDVSCSDLFSEMNRKWDGFCLGFLMALYTALWSCLFIIPGIIKTFSYSMAPYIMAENPNLTANEAITESRRIMNGNKGNLFGLLLSFISWELLCFVPCFVGIAILLSSTITVANVLTFWWILPCFGLTLVGYIFLLPYIEATSAAFYRDITAKPEYF